MTNRSFKYLLLAGLAVGMTASNSVMAGNAIQSEVDRDIEATADTDRHEKYFEKTLEKLSDSASVWPVIDITSIPAHAVVGIEQKLIRKRTLAEDDVKDYIRKRLSLTRKKPISGDLTTEIQEKEKEGEEETEKSDTKKPKVVDGKLSKIKIKTSEATSNVDGGLVGTGDGVTDAGKSSTRDLANKQREGYTSSAGSLSEQQKYELQRQYQEQEEAIRMLALAVALRSSIDEKIMPMMEEAEGHYDRTFAKKDLDPKNKKDIVREKKHEQADQNQVWRDYAYFSVIYDQLLSLEQQVLGLRLQAKGGLAEQSTEPVVEMEYTD